MRFKDLFKKPQAVQKISVVSPKGHIEKELYLPKDDTQVEHRREGIKNITREGNMDRKRIEKEVYEECHTCPSCGSKNTTEEIKVFWGEQVIEHYHVCDECDCSWHITAEDMKSEISKRLEEFQKNKKENPAPAEPAIVYSHDPQVSQVIGKVLEAVSNNAQFTSTVEIPAQQEEQNDTCGD